MRQREERQATLRRIERERAAPPPFRVDLAGARTKWSEWEAAHNARRQKGISAATEKFGAAVAYFLADVHLPQLPPSTEILAYALALECGHEDFWFIKREGESQSRPTRAPCPISWSCQFSDGRTAVRYIKAADPESQFAGLGLTRRSVALSCGHDLAVWIAEPEESRLGDFVVCQKCGDYDPERDVEIVAIGERLPDLMVQNWEVELSCGHIGTDYFVPVDFRDHPAEYTTQERHHSTLRCFDEACNDRTVQGVRRLGILGKLVARPAPPLDRVAQAAGDLKLRLNSEERQALIRRLQDEA
jgi:hypothetical protein